MKTTGKINPFTGEEVLKAEASDIDWLKTWGEMSIEERANFCSLNGIKFLSDDNREYVESLYESQRASIGGTDELMYY